MSHTCVQDTNNLTCNNRRDFLLGSATTVVASMIPNLEASVKVKKKSYPRKKIISLAELKANEPFYFAYPSKAQKNSFIVKLEEKAAAGVGEDGDIVAFNQYCTHMGASMEGTYKKVEKIMGACPMHLTTFDLTRHGMVVSGHATESLVQVSLELKDGVIYAVGMSGLMYGYSSNLSGS